MSGPQLKTQFSLTVDETVERQMAEMSDLAVWFASNLQQIADGMVPICATRMFAQEALKGGRAIYQRDLNKRGLEHG